MNTMNFERDTLNDFLATQKHISSTYNTYAAECVCKQLKDDMLSILNEEQQIQSDIFGQMQSKGWYQVKQADAQQIDQVKQKLTSM